MKGKLLSKDKMTVLAEKWLTEKFGAEFYNDLGNLRTAKEEAAYFVENNFDEFDGYETFDDWFEYTLKSWTYNFITLAEKELIEADSEQE